MLSQEESEEGPSGLSEVEILREQVRQLTLEREQFQLQRREDGESTSSESTSSRTVTPPTRIVTRFVQLARERKCPLFSGGVGEDTLPVETWVAEVRKCWEGQDWTVAEQVLFISDHLTGNARAEVEFHPERERATPAQIFALLKEHFTHSQSYVHTLAQFCQRHQKPDESVREFSYGLKRLMETIERNTPGAVPNSDQLLRDQLVEHVRDPVLRRLLDQRLAANPRLTFPEARAVAVKWEEARPAVTRARARSQSLSSLDVGLVAATREVRAAAEGTRPRAPAPAPTMPVDDTQRQLAELTRVVTQLVGQMSALHAPARSAPAGPRPGRAPDGRPVCFQCGMAGHIARFCPQPPALGPGPGPRPTYNRAGGPPQTPALTTRAQEALTSEAGNALPLPTPAPGLGEM